MDDQAQNSSGIRDAIKRLSSVLNRSASTATTTLKRSKSKTFNSIGSLPGKDAVPPRSALRGSRSPGISDRRVSFYDSLPCLAYGPTFTVQLPYSAESAERRGGLLLPAITADDRSADENFREVENDREQSAMKSAARHDSSVEPVSLYRLRSLRLIRTSGSLSGNAERRKSCMDLTKAMMQENARSQSKSRTRPLSFLTDRTASRDSLRSNDRKLGHVPLAKEVHPRKLGLRMEKQIPMADDLDEISHVYKEHVDRSLRSMQGADKRGSAYLHESLVEMHEALTQAMAEINPTKPSSTDEDEADHAYAHTVVPHHLLEADDSRASHDKTDDAFSLDMPYDSAQPSAEAIESTEATHLEAPPRLHALGASDQSDGDSMFDAALMPLPLRIRPHHPRRDSPVVQ
ncbi:hypothetical protein MBLNU13_g08437t1 [Cladosporium sp. NU13]